MTYRCRFLLLAMGLLVLLTVPVSAAPAAEMLPGQADILLLHEEQLSDFQLENLRLLADTATALGKSMEIGTRSQVNRLGAYSLILCYDLNSDPTFTQRLVQSGAKLLVLGGNFLPGCLRDAAPAVSVQAISLPDENGILRVSFSETQSYEAIVSLPELLFTADTEYTSGTLETSTAVFPFCSQVAGVRYIPLTDFRTDLSRAALMRELSVWLWDYAGEPPQRGQYLVLDQVYPYMPAQELLDRVQIFVDAGLPFVISVMPVYQNADYPAMQQFCEVLRYAQANGGSILLHTPILRSSVTDWDAFSAVITEVLEHYTAQGVYPLGFDVPYSWTWDPDALAWMKRSRTIFVHSDAAEPAFTRDTRQNLLYYNYNALVLPALALDDSGENGVLQFSAAQRISSSISLDQLRTLAEHLQGNRSPYYSLWDSNQSVWADGFHLSWQDHALTLNDTICSLAYTPQPYPEHYDYKRNVLQRFTVSIQNESHFLIVLVCVVTVLFLLMIWYARQRLRHHFLSDSNPTGPAAPASGPKHLARRRKGGKHG